MQGKYVNKYVNDGIGIKKIKLFFTTALGEKFFYLYKYQHNGNCQIFCVNRSFS